MEKITQTSGKTVPLMNEQLEDEIDLLELFFAITGEWKAIILSILLGMLVFGAYHTVFVKPKYQADAQIFITNTDSIISFSDLQLSSALTEDYASIIKSRTVMKKVIQELGLDLDFTELAKLIRVDNPDSTHIIHIYVTCDNLELSRDIANALLNISVDRIYEIVGSSLPTIIDYSEADAVKDIATGILRYLLYGAIFGFVVVCAFVVIRVLLNTTLKTEEDIEKYLHQPVLAAVPYFNEINSR